MTANFLYYFPNRGLGFCQKIAIQFLRKALCIEIDLKPTLHGGFYSCQKWIELAEARKIDWWITSALESNVGLNAISQFTANYPITIPQGLGTGTIYSNNILSPLIAEKGILRYDAKESWDLSDFS